MVSATGLLVSEARYLASNVLGLTFINPGGTALAPWTPGAHIDVILPSSAIRSYSLCGDPGNRFEYHVAVLRVEHGIGGSVEIHDTQLVGRTLQVVGPINAFELVKAAHHVFIAGGIGITPLLPMMRQVAAQGGTWEMHYLGRSRNSMAFLGESVGLAQEAGQRHWVVAGDEGRRFDVTAALAGMPEHCAVYCCGPEKLLCALEVAYAAAPGSRSLHLERFGRPTLAQPTPATTAAHASAENATAFTECDPSGPFQVRLARTGITLPVAPHQSILEVARTVRRNLTFSCSSGYCGTCETRVLGGTPHHRDVVLTDAEKATNQSMMICVGRSCTSTLVLDL